MALDADRKNGPAARSFAADAHDCIMVRIKRPYRIQVCGTKMCPNGELASDPQQTDRHRPDAEDMQKVPVAGHLRSANLIPGDGTKNGLSRSEQKTVSTTQTTA
jgi:hypothetical protein